MERQDRHPELDQALREAPQPLSPEDELRVAFGRAIGFALAAIILLVGGGILLILLAAAFFNFIYG
jgi:hypothetical protein